MLNLRLAQPERLIDITAYLNSRADRDGDYPTLGACVTHSLEDGAAKGFAHGILESVARGIACRAVRNRGTIGGSIAHADPAADWPVVAVSTALRLLLMPMNSAAHVFSRISQGLLETARQRGEILTAVHIPSVPQNARWGYKFVACTDISCETIAGVFLDPTRRSRAVIGATEARPMIVETTFTDNNAMEVIEAHIPLRIGINASSIVSRLSVQLRKPVAYSAFP